MTPEVRIVEVEPAPGETLFDWRAGQFASLRFDGQPPRDYSIANVPGDGRLAFHVRCDPNASGGVSAYVNDRLAVGDALELQGPYGRAWFRRDHPGPVLAIAGGTGLAPMKAVVEDALAVPLRRDVHLYFGCRDEREIYLERYFIDLMHERPNFRFITVLSEPKEHGGRRTGPVGQAVAADFQLLYGHQCYMAGPPKMVEACRSMLELKAVPAHDMFADAYHSEAEMRRLGEPRPVWD